MSYATKPLIGHRKIYLPAHTLHMSKSMSIEHIYVPTQIHITQDALQSIAWATTVGYTCSILTVWTSYHSYNLLLSLNSSCDFLWFAFKSTKWRKSLISSCECYVSDVTLNVVFSHSFSFFTWCGHKMTKWKIEHEYSILCKRLPKKKKKKEV